MSDLVVTAAHGNTFWAQVQPGSGSYDGAGFSGLELSFSGTKPAPGDVVRVGGSVASAPFEGLFVVNAITVVVTGMSLPAATP